MAGWLMTQKLFPAALFRFAGSVGTMATEGVEMIVGWLLAVGGSYTCITRQVKGKRLYFLRC